MPKNVVAASSTSGRAMLLRLAGALVLIALLVFSVCISARTYFSALAWKGMAAAFVVFFVCWILAFVRYIQRNKRTLSTRNGPIRLGRAGMVGYVVLLSAAASWMCWIVLYACISLLIFTTSRTAAHVPATLEVIHTPGRCPNRYVLDNAPIGRRLSFCGIAYAGAQSGDPVVIVERLGPFGAYLDHLKRGRDE